MREVKRSVRMSARDVVAEIPPSPTWVEPQLCKLVTQVPTGDAWAHEIRLDGYRMHARVVAKQATLLTRNGLDWAKKYLTITTARAALEMPADLYRRPVLRRAARRNDHFRWPAGAWGNATLVYFAFDLLHLDDEDLTKLPMLERKANLETFLWRAPAGIRFSSHAIGNGARVYEEAAEQGSNGSFQRRSTHLTGLAIAAYGSKQRPSTGRNHSRRLDRSGGLTPRGRLAAARLLRRRRQAALPAVPAAGWKARDKRTKSVKLARE